MNITEILQRQAETFPHELAIIDVARGKDRRTTYGEFDEAVGKMTTLLRKSGLQPGNRVLVFQPMSTELYIGLAAILRGGMTAMFVDPSAGRKYINRCCELMTPQGLIASPKAHLLRLLSPALRRIPVKWSVGGHVPFTRCIKQFKDCSNDEIVHPCSTDTPALASFTSGTGGQPKAVIRTHGFLLAQHRAVEEHLSLVPGEIELVTMPIFLLANLASRVTSVIADADLRKVGEIAPAPIIRQIRIHGVDRFTASPAFFERIVDFCEEGGTQLGSLRKIFTGGGPVPCGLLERLQAIAPLAEITAVYGSTEAEPICTITSREMDLKENGADSSGRGLLAGKPVTSLDVRIIRDRWGHSLGQLSVDEFTRLCRQPAEPGEIVVSGPHVLDGYVNEQADNANKFCVDQTRWHRTGDAGYFDDRGRLWLLGRCSARIDDQHGTLYPLGVEQTGMHNPCIDKAAMVSHRGQRVLAVTLKDPKNEPDFTTLLKSLAFANVDTIRVMKTLPVDTRHQSKIDYSLLQEMLEQ
jgi:acyl-CoA synthetase (AMP-forming)/AMP-acid ligase II